MARSAKPNVGVIGLGLIGSRVAANLRKAGYQVWVWSRSPRPEPNFLSSAAEVAESAKQIQIFVSDGAALLETVKAMAPALGPEHVVINHSTVSPAETVAASHVVQERHAKYLDAPFTGSRDAAAAGEIVFYIGGDAGALEKVRPQLEVNAKAILPVGEIGQAAALKIAMNVIVAVSSAAYTEALAIIDRSGIPLYKLGEAFQLHGANSALGNMKLPGMIKGNFEPSFALKHMFKDVQIALNMASEYGIDLPASTAFAGAAMSGLQSGWAEEDFTVLARQYGFPNADHEIPEGTFPASGATSEPGSGTSASAAPAKKGLFPLFGPKS